MPTLNYLERTILVASDNKDMFREKFITQSEEQSSPVSTHSRELSTDSKRRTFINLTSGNRFQLPHSAGPKDCHFFETKIIYTGRKIPIQIPITGTPDIVGDVSHTKQAMLTLVLRNKAHQLLLGSASLEPSAISTTSPSDYLRATDAPHHHLVERVINRETDRLYWVRPPVWRSSTLRSRGLRDRKRRKRHAPWNHRASIPIHGFK